MNDSNEIEQHQMKVMILLDKSSPSSVHYVIKRNAQEFQKHFSRAVSAILNQNYLDDYLDSADTEQEALNFILSVIQVHTKSGFRFRNRIESISREKNGHR